LNYIRKLVWFFVFWDAGWKFWEVLLVIQDQIIFFARCKFLVLKFIRMPNVWILFKIAVILKIMIVNLIDSFVYDMVTQFLIFWTSKALKNKACVDYVIFFVQSASKQRVIICIITANIVYTDKISRYVLLSRCTLLRIVQNSSKTKTFLVQIHKTRKRHLRCTW